MAIAFSDDKRYIIKDNSQKLIYVHKYSKNFEKEAATAYFKEKQKNKDAMLKRYKTRLMASIKLDSNTKNLLNLGSEDGQDQLMKLVDQEVTKGLQSTLGNAPSDLAALTKQARQAFDPKNIETLDEVLDKINKGILLFANEGNALSIILNNYLSKDSNSNLQGLYDELKDGLSVADKEGKIIGFNSQSLNKAAQSLMNLISAARNQSLTSKSISSYLANILSTDIGEGLIAKGIATKMIEKSDELINPLIDTLLAGSKTPIQYSVRYSDEYFSLKNQTYKPDVSAENFKIEINEGKDWISINLGLSIKSYDQQAKEVSIVTNKPFNQLLSTLFSGDYGKYLTYNTLGLLSDTYSQYIEMKKAIVLSYADNFLTGTGLGNDFSQYIVINGKVYPAYDILKSVVENTTGAFNNNTDASDPIVISIQGASEIVQLRNAYPGRDSIKKAWQRSEKINEIISGKLKVHGSLVLSKIKAAQI